MFSTLLHLPGVGGRVVTGAGRASRGSRPTWRTPPPRPRPFTRFSREEGGCIYTAPKLAHTSSASTQNPLLDIKMVLVIDWETRIQQVECSVVRSEVCGSALGVVAPSH